MNLGEKGLTGAEESVLMFLYECEEGIGADGPNLSMEAFNEAVVGLLMKEAAEVTLFDDARELAEKLLFERDEEWPPNSRHSGAQQSAAPSPVATTSRKEPGTPASKPSSVSGDTGN